MAVAAAASSRMQAVHDDLQRCLAANAGGAGGVPSAAGSLGRGSVASVAGSLAGRASSGVRVSSVVG
eukprot:6745429-Ditylum_brightwellii.AAC.1